MKNNTSQPPVPTDSNIVNETFNVEGMTCGGCVRHVRTILAQLPVQLTSIGVGKASLSYDPTQIQRVTIVNAITDAGYSVQ